MTPESQGGAQAPVLLRSSQDLRCAPRGKNHFPSRRVSCPVPKPHLNVAPLHEMDLEQWFSVSGKFVPKRHLAMFVDILVVTRGDERCWRKVGMLLDIQPCRSKNPYCLFLLSSASALADPRLGWTSWSRQDVHSLGLYVLRAKSCQKELSSSKYPWCAVEKP